jgi:nicotinamidase-related amidase
MAETNIVADRTALVVIDLQRGIASMPVFPRSSDEVISNAARIASEFRKRKMPVFLVRVLPAPPLGLRPVSDAQPPFIRDMPSDWAEIVPDLGPMEGDVVITKRQWGAFYGTELEMQLRRRGIDTIVLCGISTSIGVESTARFAYEFGFNQIFVEDAMAARSEEEHRLAIRTTFPRMGRVRSTQDVLAALSL